MNIASRVEGTKEDTGFMGFFHCDEECSHCGETTHDVPTDRVSLCAWCGREIFPCAGCYDDKVDGVCEYSMETRSCQRFSHSIA